MTDIITSGALQSLKSFFMKKKEKNTIIDPFSCLLKLSMLKYLDKGTKISVHQNRLCFNSPTIIQGVVRFIYGDGREDLHNIFQPIQKCVEWFWDDKNDDMVYMFNNSVTGLKILKQSYSTYATIQHTIDYYIIVLMQKNNNLILTAQFAGEAITLGPAPQSLPDTVQSTHYAYSAYSQQGLQAKGNIDKVCKSYLDMKIQIGTQQQGCGTPQQQGCGTLNDDTSTLQRDMQRDMQKDIHKFLFELWNDREIKIVINLFKELEAKHGTNEQDYIFTNLMQYCEMKENKLYRYIEEHSSIL